MNIINKHKSRNRISKIICFILKKNCIAFHNPSVEKILNNSFPWINKTISKY